MKVSSLTKVVQGGTSPLRGMTACPELEALPVPTQFAARRDDVSPNSHEVGVKNRREIFELPEDASPLQSVQGLNQTLQPQFCAEREDLVP